MTWNVEAATKNLQQDRDIDKEDKDLIIDYINEQKTVKQLGTNRVLKLFCNMKALTKLKGKQPAWKKFRGRKAIVNMLGKITGRDYSAYTVCDLKCQLKAVYRWMVKDPHPAELEGIKTAVNGANKKKAEDMLDESDILRMVEAAKFVRDKALIATLWETGGRATEVKDLQKNDILIDEMGARIHLRGTKTPNADRWVRVVLCVPYLQDWLTRWHTNKNKDAPVWLMLSNSGKGKPMTYAAMNMLIRRIAKKAGVTKPIHPHNFRSSRASFLAKHMNSALLKSFFGWSSIEMGDVYIALSSRDTDEAILKLHNMGKEAKAEPSKLEPVKCPRCKYVNGTDSQFCAQCAYPLTPDAMQLYDQKRAKRELVMDKLVAALEQADEKKRERILKDLDLI